MDSKDILALIGLNEKNIRLQSYSFLVIFLKRWCYNFAMCTCIIFNGNKTIVGFNFDNPGFEYKIITNKKKAVVSLKVGNNHYEDMFGVSSTGNFINVPTMWPERVEAKYKRSTKNNKYYYIDRMNNDFLNNKITFDEIISIVKKYPIINEKNVNLQCQDSDKYGNILELFPGVKPYYRYTKRPRFNVLTNFQTLEKDTVIHPWSGRDRYEKATKMLESAKDNFDVKDAFEILAAVKQTIVACPTDVSMVYDATENIFYYVEHMDYNNIKSYKFK